MAQINLSAFFPILSNFIYLQFCTKRPAVLHSSLQDTGSDAGPRCQHLQLQVQCAAAAGSRVRRQHQGLQQVLAGEPLFVPQEFAVHLHQAEQGVRMEAEFLQRHPATARTDAAVAEGSDPGAGAKGSH